jgi:hypothetical protein
VDGTAGAQEDDEVVVEDVDDPQEEVVAESVEL